MPQDFEKSAKMVLDAEQQWKENAERASQEMKAVKFHDTSASVMADFEKLEAMNFAQNQAPLDMVAELKAINERLDLAEKGNRKQTTENRIWQAVCITIGLLTLIATVLFGMLGLSH